ncbi:MAG: phage head-tail connector protein [Clostridia bacterium]|nr:phage head-tail connector protein [Clostridia bacterium]
MLLPRLKALLELDHTEEDPLLLALLLHARDTACALTGREELPEALAPAVVEMALCAYNRRGSEGEASRSEGGVAVQYEGLSEGVRGMLRRYTLARVGP